MPARKRLRVIQGSDNIFLDLGFPAEEAENLLLRSQLMTELERVISGMTQVQAARLVGVSQPRISDLKRGRIDRFTIDALVNMLANAGRTVRLITSRRSSPRRRRKRGATSTR